MNKYIMLAAFVSATVTAKSQAYQRSQKAIEYAAAYHERDSTKAVQLGTSFLEKYPQEIADFKKDSAEGIQYYRIYVNVISRTRIPLEVKIKEYYNRLTYLTVVDLYYRQVNLLYQNKIMPPKDLIERSALLLKKLASFKQNKPIEFLNSTDQQWKETFNQSYYNNLLIHVALLKATGNIAEGIKYADEAIGYFGYTNASLNENYALLLQASSKFTKMHLALENAVKANQVTPAMLNLLKNDYLEKGNLGKNFEKYINSLKDVSGIEAQEKELAEAMINQDLPFFKMYDQYGKLVSTKDWKGKIVILDFFAMWCVPCKAAFPGMKMAQENFKGDDSVLFYFVDNQEKINKDLKKNVVNYMKDNNFPFHVLFDNEGDKGLNNQVAKLLGVSAIPHKMVIDGEGKLRFSMEGYFGSPSKLADEIKIMVNLIKKENANK